jgi:Domain of unknown function (DUF5666)
MSWEPARRGKEEPKERNMRIGASIYLLCVLVLTAVSPARSAGENIMGTVKTISANSITVETMGKEPKAVIVTLSPSTKFIKDGTDTSVKDLKVGDRVVINVKPNGDKLEAVKVVFGKMFEDMDMHH